MEKHSNPTLSSLKSMESDPEVSKPGSQLGLTTTH